MALEVIEPFLKGEGGRNTRGMLRIIILCTIAAAAVSSRLFSVIRESDQTIIWRVNEWNAAGLLSIRTIELIWLGELR